MDAGQRWLLINILGNPLRTWDERNHEFQYFYDILHRPTQSKVLGGDGDAPLNHIFDRIFYGEAEANPELKNLRGQVIRHYDTGGVIETPEYDFKGQPKSTTRKLFKNYKSVANWIDANLVADLEADRLYLYYRNRCPRQNNATNCPRWQHHHPFVQRSESAGAGGGQTARRCGRHALRHRHRLRRQGPAHADRLRQRGQDNVRIRPAHASA